MLLFLSLLSLPVPLAPFTPPIDEWASLSLELSADIRDDEVDRLSAGGIDIGRCGKPSKRP